MPKYASQTTVSENQTISDIESILEEFGANDIAYGMTKQKAKIAFSLEDRHIVFELAFPDKDDEEFLYTPTKKQRRSEVEVEKFYRQERKRLLRALLLCIRAKLESIESGIETVEEAFLAQIAMPDGKTMGQWAAPQIEKMYEDGESPPPLMLTD